MIRVAWQRVARQRVAWWVFAAVAVGGMLVTLPFASTLENNWFVVPQVAYLLVGGFLAWRRPGNPVGWLMFAVAMLSGLIGAGNSLSNAAFEGGTVPVPWWGILGAWLNAWVWVPLFGCATVFTFLLFPDGLPSRRWRPLLWASVAYTVCGTIASALVPTLVLGDGTTESAPHVDIPNPISPPSFAELGTTVTGLLDLASGLGAFVFVTLSVVSLLVRARYASPVVRLQLRWFGMAALAVVATFAVSPALEGSGHEQVVNVLFSFAVATIPLACGIAVLRYRLYDIDRVISRTLSYAIVTGLLVLTYVLVVTSVSRLLGAQSTFAVAGATLVAAALFRPLLARVRRVVDRRFNREQVDGQRAVDAFGSSLRDEIDPEHARRELIAVTRRTLAPASLSLVVLDGSR